ncbi:MAG: cell division protein FtsL [Hyphomicrobiaceae bacterium]
MARSVSSSRVGEAGDRLTPSMRTINLVLLILALTSAFALYVLKYDTRRMEVRVQTLERSLDQTQEEIGLLKARHAHLARPERIEPLARALGLAPIGTHQYLRVEAPATSPATGRP